MKCRCLAGLVFIFKWQPQGKYLDLLSSEV